MSLIPKLDELQILAANSEVAVIGITELWIDASVTDSEVEIPGYMIEIVTVVACTRMSEMTLLLTLDMTSVHI